MVAISISILHHIHFESRIEILYIMEIKFVAEDYATKCTLKKWFLNVGVEYDLMVY
jgi:hypothetical protein